MPKVIDCSPEKMAEVTRAILLEKGMEACTIRAVAEACDVSVGTVYTYFPSKNVLMVNAVAGEWLQALEKCQTKKAEREEPVVEIGRFFADMLAFGMKYREVFLHLIYDDRDGTYYIDGHRMLVQQVREALRPMLAESQAADDFLMDFLANMIIFYVRKAMTEKSEGEYEKIRTVIARLLR